MEKRVAVILSGCGFKDGSEITEAVSTLIALSEAGARYLCFAPNKSVHTVNHVGFKKTSETRNILEEAARIARGEIQDIAKLRAQDFDALALPGGYGAATNLCSWATDGAAAKVEPEVERVVREFHKASKPIAAVCIAPVIVATVLGKEGVTVTIGQDAGTAAQIEKTGAIHENCAVTDYVTDRHNKIITTPAYMYGARPHEVFQGIRGAMRELVEMA